MAACEAGQLSTQATLLLAEVSPQGMDLLSSLAGRKRGTICATYVFQSI